MNQQAQSDTGHRDLNSPAVYGINAAGSTSTDGYYGNAGTFAIQNAHNKDDALFATTNGAYGIAIHGKITNAGSDISVFDGAAVVGEDASTNANGIGVLGETATGIAVLGSSSGSAGVAVKGVVGASGVAAVYGFADDGGAASSALFDGGGSGGGVCYFDGGPGWHCTSDRNLKADFRDVNPSDLLNRLDRMPVYTYAMKNAHIKARYLGPTAQDFHAAFGLGDKDTFINTANAQGVALAAAKALITRAKADEAQIAALKAEVAALRKENDKIAGLQNLVAQQTVLIQKFGAELDVLAHSQPLVRASATP